jgi:hypothetical protein
MLNSKTKITTALLTTLALSNANAQFYDLNDQGMAMPTGNYKTAVEPEFTESSEPVMPESTGDELGFIPEQDPDVNPYTSQPVFNALPVANGFDAFSNQMVAEESVKEQLRDIKQLDYIGFLDSKFDEALWVGVDYDYAKSRFAKFKDIKSIHMRKVARDMLVAKARVPQTDESWLVLRLQTLAEMGNLSDVKLLLKEVKPKELILLENQKLNNLYLQANLLEEPTYDFIKKLLEQDPSNVTYKKAFLVSLYNQGKVDQAKLSFNALVDADSEVKASEFAKIFTALLNNTELDLAEFSKLDTYSQYLVALNPVLFKGVNFNNFTDQTLTVAMENADSVSAKTMYAEVLMQNYPFSYGLDYLTLVYEEHKFETKDLSVPLKYIQSSEDEYANRALLYQSSKIKGLNSTKALSLKKLWESYSANNLNNLKLIVTEKTQGILVNSSIAWFSLDLLKNELKQAQIDYKTLNTLYENIDNAYMSTSALNLQIAVEFLRKTSLTGSDFDSVQDYKETLQTWFDTKEIKTSADYNYVLKVLTLLDALEAPISEDMWASLYEYSDLATNDKANPVWLRLITNAMQKDEKGKSLLLVLEKFVKDDEQTLDPQTLANIIATLNYLNMPQEMALVGVNSIVK